MDKINKQRKENELLNQIHIKINMKINKRKQQKINKIKSPIYMRAQQQLL